MKSYDQYNQEICGLKWSPEGDYFASGGNENKAFVFSLKVDIPVLKMNHKAAVRAIDWSPHSWGILATGGGTADQTIKIWNHSNGDLIAQKSTGSQICCL